MPPPNRKEKFGTISKENKKSFLPQTVYFKRRNKTGKSREKLLICWGGYQIYRSKPFKSHSEGTKSLENREFFKRKFLKNLMKSQRTVSGKNKFGFSRRKRWKLGSWEEEKKFEAWKLRNNTEWMGRKEQEDRKKERKIFPDRDFDRMKRVGKSL